MRKILLLSLLCAVIILSSCGDSEPVFAPGDVSIVSGNQSSPEQPDKAAITKEGERITITTLGKWNEFNHDGNFTDNCKSFLRMFIEGYSEFDEFGTVKITDWELIRDPDIYGYDLAFNFTVTESALDTLPAGSYKTTVKDAVDCYMTFEGQAPNAFVGEITSDSNAVKAVKAWITSYYNWYMPKYGTASKVLPCVNYIIELYGENGMISFADFNKALYEKLGINAEHSDLEDYIITVDGEDYLRKLQIGGNTEYAVIKEVKDGDITTVTVQYFADCNRFILSDTVEYYISDELKLLGCNIISYANYKPYGVKSAF